MVDREPKNRLNTESLPPIVESPGPFIPVSESLRERRVAYKAQVERWKNRYPSGLRVKGK